MEKGEGPVHDALLPVYLNVKEVLTRLLKKHSLFIPLASLIASSF